jgi:amino acid transporter
MVFTAFSYAKMVRAFPVAGSAYTFTQKSFGASIGFLVGWALLLDYVFLPMINYMVVGIYMEEEFPSIPFWVWVVGSILVVTLLNIRGVQAITKLNFVLVAYQVVFLAVFVVLTFADPNAGGILTLAPFYTDGVNIGDLFSGAAILCLSFLGFDAVSTLAEEAKDAHETIPRAIIIVTVLGGLIFIFVSYVGYLAFPDYTEFTDVDSAALDVVVAVGGDALSSMFIAGIVSGALASALASQASVSRLLYAMGRDAALPRRVFAYLHPRYHTPVYATLVVSTVALSALYFSLVTVSSFISFGALVAFSAVNLAVIMHYYVRDRRRSGSDIVNFVVFPGLGFAMVLYLWTSLSANTFVLGLSWAAIGFAYLLYLTRFFSRPAPELTFTDEADGSHVVPDDFDPLASPDR